MSTWPRGSRRMPPSPSPSLLPPQEGYNEAMGARELRRAVTRLVDDALSDAVLRGEVRPPPSIPSASGFESEPLPAALERC